MVQVQREPFESNGERVETFAEGTRFSKHRLWRVEIGLPGSISGPLVIGDGRFLGLGIMAPLRRAEILRLANQRGAHDVRVFGSVARGEANENSDLDLLVAWEPGRSLLDHAGLVQDLQDLLGVKVHVGTEKSLHWYVRDRILREATPL